MRHRASPIALLAVGVFTPLACSLAVSSELDGKATDADASADSGKPDASKDVRDEEAEVSPDAPNDVQEEGCGECPESCCNGACADLMTDPLNCGQCGHRCLAGRDCLTGECARGFAPMGVVGAPEPRLRACAVWTGLEMFVWGGIRSDDILLNSGAAYDPKTDKWREVSMNGAPTPREQPTCVAMNDKVFVWGGVHWPSELMTDGAVWHAATDSWTPLGEDNEPAPRIRSTALWTDDAVLIWGGEKLDGHQEKSGAIYDPVENTWKSISTSDAPAHAKRQAWAWTGTVLYVFGGRDDSDGIVYNDFHSYSPANDTWSPIVDLNAPSARSNAFAAWTGTRLLVWGGLAATQVGVNDGASFDATWSPLSGAAPPTARGLEMFRSGWSQWLGNRMLIAGGSDLNGVQPNLALFNPNADENDAWSPAQSWSSTDTHEGGVGVWTGEEFIVWGGSDGSNPLVSGSRWMP